MTLLLCCSTWRVDPLTWSSSWEFKQEMSTTKHWSNIGLEVDETYFFLKVSSYLHCPSLRKHVIPHAFNDTNSIHQTWRVKEHKKYDYHSERYSKSNTSHHALHGLTCICGHILQFLTEIKPPKCSQYHWSTLETKRVQETWLPFRSLQQVKPFTSKVYIILVSRERES